MVYIIVLILLFACLYYLFKYFEYHNKQEELWDYFIKNAKNFKYVNDIDGGKLFTWEDGDGEYHTFSYDGLLTGIFSGNRLVVSSSSTEKCKRFHELLRQNYEKR